MPEATTIRPRGRPPAASREDVLKAALSVYVRGGHVEVQALAAELGVARTTIHRWFGSREGLLGEVLFHAAEPLLDAARAQSTGRGGPMLLETFDHFNRSLADAPALRTFIERERDSALRVITSGAGYLQSHIVERIAGLISDEAGDGHYEPPVDPATLGYAIVRLAEAFLFNDAAAGIRGDVERLRAVEAALLGVTDEGR